MTAPDDELNDGPWYAGAIGRIPEDDCLVYRDDAVHGPQFYAASPEDAEAAARQLNAAEARGAERMREEAAETCDREVRACMNHSRAFGEMRPQKRMTLAKAHEMAANQSQACGHYIRALSTAGRSKT